MQISVYGSVEIYRGSVAMEAVLENTYMLSLQYLKIILSSFGEGYIQTLDIILPIMQVAPPLKLRTVCVKYLRLLLSCFEEEDFQRFALN